MKLSILCTQESVVLIIVMQNYLRGVSLCCQLLFNACHHSLSYVYFPQLLEGVLLTVLIEANEERVVGGFFSVSPFAFFFSFHFSPSFPILRKQGKLEVFHCCELHSQEDSKFWQQFMICRNTNLMPGIANIL